MERLSNLSDAALLRELHTLAGAHRRVTAELIAHLGEVDARRLHVDNHRELLAGVSGASVRKAKEWLAALFPMPDVRSSIRKLPERQRSAPLSAPDSLNVRSGAEPIVGGQLASGAESTSLVQPAPTRGLSATEPAGRVQPAPTMITRAATVLGATQTPRARVDPLSSDRFLVKLTVSRALRDKFELARDLMGHVNPDGDLSVILERAVDLLIAKLEKKRKGSTTRPLQTPRPARDGHVTRSARREVVARDRWRCSFVAEDGRACDAQAYLEFDHETPRGCGGGSQPDNLRLLCRAHNRLAAERVYGKERIAHASSIAKRAQGETRTLLVEAPPSLVPGDLTNHETCPCLCPNPAENFS